MRRVLGVTCSGSDAYLTVIDVEDDGESAQVREIGPARVSPINGSDRGDSLVRTLGEWKRVVELVAPDVVSVLLPESHKQTKQVHSYWAPRCEAETLAGLAAGLAEVPIDFVSRATVRAQLKIEGKLDVAAGAATKHGKFWGQRALAMFAAQATAHVAAEHGWSHLGTDDLGSDD
jgi:hypothetical protein